MQSFTRIIYGVFQLLRCLSSMHITLSDNSKAKFLASVSQDANKELIEGLRSGLGCKGTLDNADGKRAPGQVGLFPILS